MVRVISASALFDQMPLDDFDAADGVAYTSSHVDKPRPEKVYAEPEAKAPEVFAFGKKMN